MFSKPQSPNKGSPDSGSDCEIPSHPSGAIPKQHRRLERTRGGRDSPHPRPSVRPKPIQPLVFEEVTTDPPGACVPHQAPRMDSCAQPWPLLSDVERMAACRQFSHDENPDFGRSQLSSSTSRDWPISLQDAIGHNIPFEKPADPAARTTRAVDADVISSADLTPEIEVLPDEIRNTRTPALRREYSTVSALTQTETEVHCWSQIQAMFKRKSRVFEWITDKARKFWAMAPLKARTQELDGAVSYSFDDSYDLMGEGEQRDGIITFLNNHPEFIEEYITNSLELDEMKSLFFKLELAIIKPYTEQDNRQPKVLQIGRGDIKEILMALSMDPTQIELVWELAASLRKILRGNALRIYKITEDWEDHVDMVTIDEGPQPGILTLQTVETSLMILETLRRKCCVYYTCASDPLNVTREWKSVFTASDNKEEMLNYVICVPVAQAEGELTFIVEIWRSSRYEMSDVEIAVSFMVWGSVAVHFFNMMMPKFSQTRLMEYLLKTVKLIFEEMGSFNHVIKHILMFAQKLVNADRASLFMIDHKNGELVSTVFDLKWNGTVSNMENEIRMPIGKGIAGHVAITGTALNIDDVYSDTRFNRAVDDATGYRTGSMLCLPVKIEGQTIAVVQMVNKRTGTPFSKEDERTFNLFSAFFGLALRHAALYDQIVRKEQKYRVALEVLSYHNTCRDSEVIELLSLQPHDPPLHLANFNLDPFELDAIEKCQAVIVMFKDLFSMQKFDSSTLSRFILTVKKNYRQVPYHNFDHGWSVAQAMYAILKNDDSGHFSFVQRLALFVASLCHDLDHRGYTNQYMSEIASPLAAIYTTSTLEHHHFNITVTILQQEGHNIFARFSGEEYKELLGLIKSCILATDLAAFFPNLKLLAHLHSTEKPNFNWNNPHHTGLAMAIVMTGADLSASAKPFEVQYRTVKVIFDEFYDQGDKERAAGREPIVMMDRRKPEEQAASQVGFINSICIPLYKMLATILPKTKDLYVTAHQNLKLWEKKAAGTSQNNEDEFCIDDDLLSTYSISTDRDQSSTSKLEKKPAKDIALDDDIVQSPVTDKSGADDTWTDAMESSTEYFV